MSVTLLVEAVWLTLAAAVAALQIVAVVRPGFPGLGDAIAALTRPPVGRALALAVWAWLGWHFFVRAG